MKSRTTDFVALNRVGLISAASIERDMSSVRMISMPLTSAVSRA
jgi:hypothetical protein